MTRRGKWVNEDAKEYLSSQEAIAWQLKKQMGGNPMLPVSTPLKAKIVVEQPKNLHRADLDNTVKALVDSAQGIVFKNDLWIDQIVAERRIGDEYRAWLTVEVL